MLWHGLIVERWRRREFLNFVVETIECSARKWERQVRYICRGTKEWLFIRQLRSTFPLMPGTRPVCVYCHMM